MIRPSFDQYVMDIARDVSMRSTCIRRQYGAVIVDPMSKRIISTGYNGAARGCPNCHDLGKCIRQELNVQPGTRYELCRSVHAEQNALLNAQCNVKGMYMYIYGRQGNDAIDTKCCLMCERFIITSGIDYVYYGMANGSIERECVPNWVGLDQQDPFKKIKDNMK